MFNTIFEQAEKSENKLKDIWIESAVLGKERKRKMKEIQCWGMKDVIVKREWKN